MSRTDLTLVLRAARLASIQHAGKRRKGASERPYIDHPIEVADILATVGDVTDPIILAAAFLHDTVEDSDLTNTEIEKQFGQKVASIVAELTDDPSLSETERRRAQVERAAGMSREAKLIKLADKISNIREVAEDTPTDWDAGTKREYIDWGADVVKGLRGINAPLERLFDETAAKARELTAAG